MTNTTIPDTIERTTELPHPVDRVWDAITDPAEFGRWFAQSASWDLREGAPMTMRWDEHGTAPGVIVAVEPPTASPTGGDPRTAPSSRGRARWWSGR